jgi:hypothetical protein
MFLSAGAFANAPVAKIPATVKANFTIIHKNSNWPKVIRVSPCDLRRCVEA